MNIDKSQKLLEGSRSLFNIFTDKVKKTDLQLAVAGADSCFSGVISFIVMLMISFNNSAPSGTWIVLAQLVLVCFIITLMARYHKFCKIRDYLIENNIQYLEEK